MRLFVIMIYFLASTQIFAQDFNLELVSQVDLGDESNDVWGYVHPTGTEYAIVGTLNDTKIFSLEDPANPILRKEIQGAFSVWRDIKHFQDYLYVIADQGSDGLLIIDMKDAPQSIDYEFKNIEFLNSSNQNSNVRRCHNLYVEEKKGILLLAGCNTEGGVLAFDLTENPSDPKFISIVSEPYSHDVFMQDSIVYASELNLGQIALYSFSDQKKPRLLGSSKTSGLFTHNAWANDDNTRVYTTDEVSNGAVDVYDISNLSNPKLVDEFIPESIRGKGFVPHNTHFLDDYIITSWYRYGVVIGDVSNPNTVVEVGHFNTHQGFGSGCWGAFPYLPSGLILASDITNGLFILKPEYRRASFLEGIIRDNDSKIPIFNATITVQSENKTRDLSDPKGEFVIGQLEEGEYEVVFDHPEYNPTSVTVSFSAGETALIEVELEKSAVYQKTFTVLSEEELNTIGASEIRIFNDESSYELVTNEQGRGTLEIIEGEYELVAGKWGYDYEVRTIIVDEESEFEILLKKKFIDNFNFDYEWTMEGPNERSMWVREIPKATFFQGQASNPGSDISSDIGEECYMTGNGLGGTGQFDVDNGTSILYSPVMDLSEYPGAELSYFPWFFNDGGSGEEPNDTLNIFISNGQEKVLLEKIYENINDWSIQSSFILNDFIELSDSVQLILEVSDDEESPHLVEAAIDGFKVDRIEISNTDFDQTDLKLNVFPNPTNGFVNLQNPSKKKIKSIEVFNTLGIRVFMQQYNIINQADRINLFIDGTPGIYFLKVRLETDEEKTFKVIKN